MLVDTGLGPKPRAFMPDADARLLAELVGAGASPDRVDLVVHTHLHVDHVGWDGFFPVLGDVVVHELQLADPDLVYVAEHDPELSAVTRKLILGRLADKNTAAIVAHFHGPGRFSRKGEGFSWSSLEKEGETAVE